MSQGCLQIIDLLVIIKHIVDDELGFECGIEYDAIFVLADLNIFHHY